MLFIRISLLNTEKKQAASAEESRDPLQSLEKKSVSHPKQIPVAKCRLN